MNMNRRDKIRMAATHYNTFIGVGLYKTGAALLQIYAKDKAMEVVLR